MLFLLICCAISLSPILASKLDADAEIINLTMQSGGAAQRTPQVKGREGNDGNGGVEPIRLVSLPAGQQRLVGIQRGGRLAGIRGDIRQNEESPPAIERANNNVGSANANPTASSGFARISAAGGNPAPTRLSAGNSLFGVAGGRSPPSSQIPLSPGLLASLFRQQRNVGGGSDQAGGSQQNLAALQNLQREQQRVLQQQQQLSFQLAIQQRAQRIQQQQQQQLQQLLASQRNSDAGGRSIELVNSGGAGTLLPLNSLNLGRAGRQNVQIQRPLSSSATGSAAINALTNGANLGGTFPIIGTNSVGSFGGLLGSPLNGPSSRSSTDGPQQDIGAALLQALRQVQNQNGATNLSPSGGQSNQIVDAPSSSILSGGFPSSPGGTGPFKLVAEEQQQRALQQILEQEGRILELVERESRRNQLIQTNRRDLLTVQEQQQRILALLSQQQQGQEGARTLVANIGGMTSGTSFQSSAANLQQPILGRILNVGQSAGFAPTSGDSQQPILVSSSFPLGIPPQATNGQQLATTTLDLGQFLQQLPTLISPQPAAAPFSAASISQQPLTQPSTIVSQFGNGQSAGAGGIPIQLSNIPSQQQQQGGPLFGQASAFSSIQQPNFIQQLLGENEGGGGHGPIIGGQIPTLADGNEPSEGALMLIQRGQPKREVETERKEDEGEKGKKVEKEGEGNEDDDGEDDEEEDGKEEGKIKTNKRRK